jgi:hypothetical protein
MHDLERAANESRFAQVLTGDVALFTPQGRVVSAGTVHLLFRSPYLAHRLWGWTVITSAVLIS